MRILYTPCPWNPLSGFSIVEFDAVTLTFLMVFEKKAIQTKFYIRHETPPGWMVEHLIVSINLPKVPKKASLTCNKGAEMDIRQTFEFERMHIEQDDRVVGAVA